MLVDGCANWHGWSSRLSFGFETMPLRAVYLLSGLNLLGGGCGLGGRTGGFWAKGMLECVYDQINRGL